MPTQTWPASLPERFSSRGLQITPGGVLVTTPADIGPPMIRSRSNQTFGRVSGVIQLSLAQLTTFINFFEVTTDFGLDPFTGLRHPDGDDDTVVWKFEPPTKPRIRSLGKIRFNATLNLVVVG